MVYPKSMVLLSRKGINRFFALTDRASRWLKLVQSHDAWQRHAVPRARSKLILLYTISARDHEKTVFWL